jgi:CubicO group peptidase (beta-lactamase class C family)
LTSDSITGVYSVSKGVATVTLATLIADGRLDLDAPVTTYWPEFGAAGKQSVLGARAPLSSGGAGERGWSIGT